ncbi:MAG: signal peptidase I [Bacilli bacterium]
MLKKIKNIVSLLITIVIVVLASIYVVPKVFGYHPTAVLSGSMEPIYPVGSLIFVQDIDPATIVKDDIITFSMGNGNTAVTHRVINVNDDQTFQTKGDANNVEDGTAVSYQRVIGKASNFAIPILGYIAVYMNTPIGYIIIGVAILTLLVLSFIGESPKKREGKR